MPLQLLALLYDLGMVKVNDLKGLESASLKRRLQ